MTKKHIPGKRLKTWHRAYKNAGLGDLSLRAFARFCLRGESVEQRDTARRWAGGKVAA